MESSESIQFDEYMEGGIPATLLKGLGYSDGGERLDMDEGSANEIEGSCEEVDEDDEEMHSQTGKNLTGSGFTKEAHLMQTGLTAAKSFASANATLPRKHRSGRIAQKMIIKGNIIYERTETGEVIASLIKTGDSVPNATSNIGQNTPKQRTRKVGTSNPVQIELPRNCPINEDNVEDILDQTIVATQDVRRMLITLKDDLRRMGGGSHVTPQLKPVHMKRRDEIAKQLTFVYVDYQDAIDKICNVAEAFSEVNAAPPPVSLQSTVSRKHPHSEVPASSPKPRKARQVSKHHNDEITIKSEERTSGVSDDLWMSCEPGSDDELHRGMTSSNKRKRGGLKFRMRKATK